MWESSRKEFRVTSKMQGWQPEHGQCLKRLIWRHILARLVAIKSKKLFFNANARFVRDSCQTVEAAFRHPHRRNIEEDFVPFGECNQRHQRRMISYGWDASFGGRWPITMQEDSSTSTNDPHVRSRHSHHTYSPARRAAKYHAANRALPLGKNRFLRIMAPNCAIP